jgi:hypothetical protein
MRGVVVLAGALGGAGAIVACNALVGNGDPVLVTADASGDAPAAAEASSPDAGPQDAGPGDAAPFACDAPPCGATAVQANELLATAIAVDADPSGYIYWSHYGSEPQILRCRKTDPAGTREILFDTPALSGEPMQMVLAGGLLYWVSNDGGQSTSIHWSQVGGGGHQSVALPYPQAGFGWAIAADSTAVYGLSRAPGAVWRLAFGASAPELLFTPPLDGGPRDGMGLGVLPGPGDPIVWTDEQAVSVMNKDGGGYYPIVGAGASNTGYGALALTSAEIFFVAPDSLTVQRTDYNGRCPGVSRCPQTVAGSDVVRSPHMMVADGSYLYWANNADVVGGSRIVRSTLDGSSVTVLAELPGNAYDLAVDSQYLYVTLQYQWGGAGSLWRTGK